VHGLVYVIGPPGAGKSTLMAELTKNCARFPSEGVIPHEALVRGHDVVGAELGRRRDDFPGTDALSMSIMPRARQFLEAHYYRLVLGEGNRLGNAAFMQAAKDAGYNVTLVHLTAADEVLKVRRAGRTQNSQWARGAAKQAANLAQNADCKVIELDADRTVQELAEELFLAVPALGVIF
jgi:ribose 1,5-bisphosphokinase PhnN